jgi:cytochrome b561
MIAFNRYLNDRLLEWGMAIAMFGIAIEIFAWPRTIEESAFRYFALVVSGQNLGVMFLLVSIARVVALVANGRSCLYGPRTRAIGALVGALIWAQLDCALFMLILLEPDNPPSPGIPIYFALTVCELISSYRAATDVRIRRA